jgi:hypothetical protein
MADTTIEFDIVARLDSVEKALKGIEKQGKETGEKLDNSLGAGLGASLKKSFVAVTAVIGTAVAGFSLLRSSIREAAEEQNAIVKLNQSLASAGTFSKEASLGIQAFADEIERTTTLSAPTVLNLTALSRNFARTNEEATKLTEAAIQLNAQFGIGLEEAVQGLGKTLNGNGGRIAQQVTALQGLSKEALKSGAALDVVLNRFGGAAESRVNTFEGALIQLGNSFGKVKESIGNIFVLSPGLVAGFKFISGQLRELAANLSSFFTSGGDLFGSFLSIAASVGKVLNFAIIGPIELILTLIKRTADALGALGAVFVQVFTGQFKQAAATFSEGVVQAFDYTTFEFAGTKAVDNFLTGFQNAVENAPPLDVTPKGGGGGVPEAMTENIQSVNLFAVAYEGLINRVKMTNEQFKVATLQLKQALFQNVVNGVQGAFSSIGSALVKGENVFAAFGKSILGLFGDIALQLGQFYLLLGIGNLFLNPGAAAGQIAAGLGLSVLGGALKALSGGGGATAPSTASTGGGVAGSGFSSGVGDTATSFADTAPTEPGTQVAVNINGNVLGDKRTLGIAVAEAINEAFGSDGAVIARGALA